MKNIVIACILNTEQMRADIKSIIEQSGCDNEVVKELYKVLDSSSKEMVELFKVLKDKIDE